MNITKHNFKEMKKYITTTFKNCNYISFDFEMTGISYDRYLQNSSFDSWQIRYWKAKENVKKFIPIQIGITGYKVNEKYNNEIISYPFNFHILPYSNNNFDLNKYFTCQTSSLSFLSDNSFDFNKLIYDGIYYISKKEELDFKNTLLKIKDKKLLFNDILSINIKNFIKINLIKIRDFLKNGNLKVKLAIDIEDMESGNYKYLEEEVIRLYSNEYSIKFSYNDKFLFYKNKLFIKFSIKTDKTPLFFGLNSFKDDLIGFRYVIDQIIKLKKPIITHNGFTDILHIYDKFIEPLPDNYQDFSKKIKKKFPIIYDTKYIINNTNTNYDLVKLNSSLDKCFNYFIDKNTNIKFEIDKNFKDYSLNVDQEDLKAHQAGYDALITGYIFFRILENMNVPVNNSYLIKEKLFFLKNRLALGSLKISFNFEDNTDYLYEKNKLFYVNFKALDDINNFKKEFINLYGSINIYNIFSQNLEVFFIFLSEKDYKNFIKKSEILKFKTKNFKLDKTIEFTVSLYEYYIKNNQKNFSSVKNMPNYLNI